MEGIRRLDKYNELVDSLPGLHSVFEANYAALRDVVDRLPREVGRILRLFDGVRSIQDVADTSPVDDITTLRIVRKLIDDGSLVDVTPRATKPTQPSRSNLAAWLQGARTDGGRAREDTSPKFGASIADMVRQRTERAEEPMGRDSRDTDPFGSYAQQKEQAERRRTQPLRDPFDSLDEDSWEEQDSGSENGRRRTALQWDRPRSGWNIHFDAAKDKDAAIREIEEEERLRREKEAAQLSGGDRDGKPSRESTLRFAPAQDRQPTDAGRDTDVLKKIEEDERRRREEEARRIQQQMSTIRPNDSPPIDGEGRRRRTDELPLQSRDPEASHDDMFEDDPPPPEPRPMTPRSSPALQPPAERSARPPLEDGWEALAPSDALDSVSEAEVFDDGHDAEPPPAPPGPADRITRDIRPPITLTRRKDADVDDGGLFESLAHEDTDPGDEEIGDLDIVDISVPAVERQATDNELVRTSYDLSRRRTIPPGEIEGRNSRERPTAQLRPLESKSVEDRFFGPASDGDDYEYEQESSPSAVPIIVICLVIALALIWVVLPPKETDAPPTDTPIAQPSEPTEPPKVVEQPPTPPPAPVGLSTQEATTFAATYGTTVGGAATQLTLVLSGADLTPQDAGTLADDAGTPEQPTEPVVVAANNPPTADPLTKPPTETKPKEPTEPKEPKAPSEPPEPKEPKEPKVEPKPVPKISKATSEEVKKAQRLVKQNKFDEALGMLRQLSQVAPKDKTIAYMHGYAAFSSNRTGEAVTHLARAERLGYRSAKLYLDLAAAYQLDGKRDRAKWAYQKFLELEPNGRQADEVRTILSTRY